MNRIEQAPEEYDLCGRVIGAAMTVHSTLGRGFLESVYQNALIWELRKAGLKSEAEKPISVHYDGQLVGAFTDVVLVNYTVIIYLTDHHTLSHAHDVQHVTVLDDTIIVDV